MFKKRISSGLTVLAMVGLALGAIGCTQQSAAQATATHVPASAVPTGNFSNQGAFMSFYTDGTYMWGVSDGSFNATGTYTVNGNQISLQNDTWCLAMIGTYTWAYDGGNLTFSGFDDKCGDRWGFMEANPWVKQ
jgi:hypothetical protein